MSLIKLTDKYKYPGEEIDDRDRRDLLIDDRLCIAVKEGTWSPEILIEMFKNYVEHFCTLLNDNPNSRIKYLAECGFLPIGIEPNILAGQINTNLIIPRLKERNIPFYQMAPNSPVRMLLKTSGAEYKTRDIWVNKIDVANLIDKPIHNITAIDVLEALGI